jgi:hypothetical protein
VKNLILFIVNKMKYYKITYRFNDGNKWIIAFRTLKANSPEDAIKKMDMYPPLIIDVSLI